MTAADLQKGDGTTAATRPRVGRAGRRIHRACLAAILSVAALVPALPARAGWPHASAANLAVAVTTGNKSAPQLASDAAGGVFVAWMDEHSGVGLPPGGTYWDIYAHHVLASGVLDPAWPAGGLPLCTAADNQQIPRIVADGAGGAIVVWVDWRNGTLAQTDLYAQHVLAGGSVDPAWPVDGRAVCAAVNTQSYPQIVSDGAGGAIVAWADFRASNFDIYAQHVLAGGTVDPAWPVDGRALCLQTDMQYEVALVSDGGGGAIATWEDYRNTTRTDVYAQHVLAGGTVDPAWPVNGLAVCIAGGEQSGPPAIVGDGAGGGIVAWCDYRISANANIYAQHVLASGTVDPAWVANGTLLCSAASDQVQPVLAGDGAGGAIVAWLDHRSGTRNDVYAHHVQAGGAADPAWPSNGVDVCAATANKSSPAILGDGAGGAMVLWADARGGSLDLYAQHVLPAGTLDSAWPADGQPVSTAANTQGTEQVVTDGAGGLVTAWLDYRSTPYTGIYAQRIARYGVPGSPEAEIAGAVDVPADQGLNVRVSWRASWLDTLPALPIGQYGIWRQVDDDVALAALARGARAMAPGGRASPTAGALRVRRAQGVTSWWECVGLVPARGDSSYAAVVQTLQDSTTEWPPFATMAPPPALLTFMVDAHAAYVPEFWDSAPVEGYSLDNLAPAVPSPFTGEYAAGTTHLHWGRNREPDFVAYRIYRGDSAGFVPAPGNLRAVVADTGWVDVAGGPYVYKLCAVDVHANASGCATLVPAGTAGVAPAGPSAMFALAGARPNPVAGGEVTLAFSLADAAPARLELLDVGGRRVSAREVGSLGAGPHVVTLGEQLRLAPGLYVVRLSQREQVRTRRVVVVR